MKSLYSLPAHRGAADVRLALEHQHLEARARQIAGGDQAVMAGADDDRVEMLRVVADLADVSGQALCGRRRSLERRVDGDLERHQACR